MTINIKTEPNKLTATISGRIDTAAAAQFATDIQTLIKNADKEIHLVCNELEFISSSGLRHLLTLRKATMAMGGKVIISGLNADVMQVFTITGFRSLFEIM